MTAAAEALRSAISRCTEGSIRLPALIQARPKNAMMTTNRTPPTARKRRRVRLTDFNHENMAREASEWRRVTTGWEIGRGRR
jgi:hypothetical protein